METNTAQGAVTSTYHVMDDTREHYSPDRIFSTVSNILAGKVLLTAIQLGLFTELSNSGPLELDTLTKRIGIHARGARDFFDTLVTMGFLNRNDGKYSNTPETYFYLNKNRDSYIGGFLEMANSRLYNIWGSLEKGLTTGNPQNGGQGQQELFEAIYSDQDKLTEFLHAMSGISHAAVTNLAKQFDWSTCSSFCDVGAAQGMCAVNIAKAQPHLRAVGFDLPPVEPVFQKFVSQNHLSDRIRFQGGDFFKDSLPKAEVIIMGHILHDWGLETKKMLIKKAHAALPRGGSLIIYDTMIDDDRKTHLPGLLMSLNMLLETQEGFDYTGKECGSWVMECGFKQCRTEHLAGPTSMLIATK